MRRPCATHTHTHILSVVEGWFPLLLNASRFARGLKQLAKVTSAIYKHINSRMKSIISRNVPQRRRWWRQRKIAYHDPESNISTLYSSRRRCIWRLSMPISMTNFPHIACNVRYGSANSRRCMSQIYSIIFRYTASSPYIMHFKMALSSLLSISELFEIIRNHLSCIFMEMEYLPHISINWSTTLTIDTIHNNKETPRLKVCTYVHQNTPPTQLYNLHIKSKNKPSHNQTKEKEFRKVHRTSCSWPKFIVTLTVGMLFANIKHKKKNPSVPFT